VDFTAVDPIARALLYEGYRLYPYRASALKNCRPCALGSLYPKSYSLANGACEPWSMQTECLVRGDGHTTLQGLVRFLQASGMDQREVAERAVGLPERALLDLAEQSARIGVSFLDDESSSLQGCVELSVACAAPAIFRVRLRIENDTPDAEADRIRLGAHTMLSPHAVLGVCGGRFLSVIDPPGDVRHLAEACRNRGAWPVLIGDRARQDMVLAAPIILYDFPEIAQESPGNLFDGTEIDELLTLRILTLTESEKQAMRHDDETSALLERTEKLATPQLLALHGGMRPDVAADLQSAGQSADLQSAGPSDDPRRLQIGGHRARTAKPGDRVRLRPARQQDILDLALEGRAARVEAVAEDIEGRVFYTVTLDDDPGRDLGREGKPGHRFFFRREEFDLISGDA
jgi:hypothetical protein